VFGVLAIPSVANLDPKSGFSKGLGPLLVGALVWSIGLSLGGPTGYAINPARDFGPRLAHFLLPIPGKTDSDWNYAWVPIVGPLIGGLLGALHGGILGARHREVRAWKFVHPGHSQPYRNGWPGHPSM